MRTLASFQWLLPVLCCIPLLAGADPQVYCTGSPTDAISLAVGNGSYAVLRSDGTIWSSLGPTASPTQGGFTALAMDEGAIWALDSNGQAVHWSTIADRPRLCRASGGPFTDLSYGGRNVFGIRADGSVALLTGVLPPPADLEPVRQIAVNSNGNFALAVLRDGHVRTWTALNGYLQPPTGLSDVVEAAIGDDHVIVRHGDGHLTLWGDDSFGCATPPINLPAAISIAAGASHSVAVLADGRLAVWGGAYYGSFSAPAGLTDAREVHCSGTWTAVRRMDGTVFMTNGSPASMRWPVTAWTRAGGDAAVIVSTEAPVAVDTAISLATTGVQIDAQAVILAGSCYGSARITSTASAEAVDRRGVIAQGDSVPPEYDPAWQRSCRYWIVDTHPRLRMSFSPSDATAIGPFGWYSFLMATDEGVWWPVGSPSGRLILPPSRSRIIAVTGDDSGMNAIALAEDGNVIASWCDWAPVPGAGRLARLVPGSPGLGIRTDNSLINLYDVSVQATDVASACQRGSDLIVMRTTGLVELISGTLAPPADLGACISIAGGDHFFAAVQASGHVVVWGNGDAELSPPVELSGVVKISAGSSHIIALRADGTVVAWGQGAGPATDVPVGLTDVVDVAATAQRSSALRRDGVVIAWPPKISALPSIAEGGRFTAVIQSDRVLDGEVVPLMSSVGGAPLVAAPVTMAAGTSLATVGVDAIADGDDISGQGTLVIELGEDRGYGLPDGGAWDSVQVVDASPQLRINWSPVGVTEVTPNGICRLADGRITGFPSYYSQVGRDLLLASPGLHGLASTAGRLLGIADDGSLRSFVFDPYASDDDTAPPANLPPVVQVAAADHRVLAALADGSVRGWGYGYAFADNAPHVADAVEVAMCGWAYLARCRDGRVVGWGWSEAPQTSVPADLPPAIAISCGEEHAAALLADGTVRVWGSNRLGQLLQPPGLDHVVSIHCSWWATYAVRADGSVVAWGSDQSLPVQVPAGFGHLVAITGGSSLLGLRDDGTVVSWGEGIWAGPTMCAEGDRMAIVAVASTPVTQDVSVTIQVFPSPSDSAHLVTPAVMGQGSSVAVAIVATEIDRDDAGDAFINVSAPGQAGLGTLNMLTLPKLNVLDTEPAISLSVSPMDLVKVASGRYCAIGLRADGRAVAWGEGEVVSAVNGRTGVVDLAMIGEHALLLLEDGRVVAYGSNDSGQCNVPDDLGPVIAVAAGERTSMALLRDGTVRCWGTQWTGYPPTPPAGLDHVVALAAGGGLGAVRDDGSVVIWDGPGPPAGLGPVAKLFHDVYGSLATMRDGTVQSWGVQGQADGPIDGLTDVATAIPGLAIHRDGSCTAWSFIGQWTSPEDLTEATDVISGPYGQALLRPDGSVIWLPTSYGSYFAPNAPVLREGDRLALRVTRSQPAGSDLSIALGWSGAEPDSGFISGPDHAVIPAGHRTGWATFRLGPDASDDTDASLLVRIVPQSGYGPDERAKYPTSVHVVDAAPWMSLTLADSSINEGAASHLSIRASWPFPVDTFWSIVVDGDAETGDLLLPAGPYRLPAGEVQLDLAYTTGQDIDLDDEHLQLTIPDGPGYRIAGPSATLTIVDSDHGADAISVGIRITRSDGSGIGMVQIRREQSGAVPDGSTMRTRPDGNADVDAVDDPGSADDPMHFTPQGGEKKQTFSLTTQPVEDG